MRTMGYEMYRDLDPKHDIGRARLMHYASVALLRHEIGYMTFASHQEAFSQQRALVIDETGHIPDSVFDIGSISVWLGSGDYPLRLFIPKVSDSQRQFTFRLDRQGQPLFQIQDNAY